MVRKKWVASNRSYHNEIEIFMNSSKEYFSCRSTIDREAPFTTDPWPASTWPPFMAVWYKALPQTASCLSPLPGFESRLEQKRMMPVTLWFTWPKIHNHNQLEISVSVRCIFMHCRVCWVAMDALCCLPCTMVSARCLKNCALHFGACHMFCWL